MSNWWLSFAMMALIFCIQRSEFATSQVISSPGGFEVSPSIGSKYRPFAWILGGRLMAAMMTWRWPDSCTAKWNIFPLDWDRHTTSFKGVESWIFGSVPDQWSKKIDQSKKIPWVGVSNLMGVPNHHFLTLGFFKKGLETPLILKPPFKRNLF